MQRLTAIDRSEPPRGSPVLAEIVPINGEGTLFVDLAFGSIRIETHDEPVVAVRADAEGWAPPAARAPRFSLAKTGCDVTVEGELRAWLPGMRVRVHVWIPRGFHVDAHTGGGEIRLERIDGRCGVDSSGGLIQIDGASGPVLASTAGGAIRLRRIESDVRARSAGGLIDVRRVAGQLDARTLGGPIRLREVSGRVDAQTGAGSISAVLGEHACGSLRTAAGPIDLRLPGEASLELDARAAGAGVRIDRELSFAGARRRGPWLRGAIGAGGATLELRAATGGIHVRAREQHQAKDR